MLVGSKSDVKLLPCPFCGCADFRLEQMLDGCNELSYTVMCLCCFARTGYKDTEKEVFDAWNVRSFDLLIMQQEISSLQKQLAECEDDAEQLADTNAQLREALESAINGPGGYAVT